MKAIFQRLKKIEAQIVGKRDEYEMNLEEFQEFVMTLSDEELDRRISELEKAIQEKGLDDEGNLKA